MATKKQKRNQIGIVVVLIIGILFASGGFGDLFSIGDELSSQGENVDELVLEGCSSVSSCNSKLLLEGMPENFLEETNSIIECLNEICVLKKK